MFRFWPLLLLFAACGRWGVEPLLSQGDAMDLDTSASAPSGRGSNPSIDPDDAGAEEGHGGNSGSGGNGAAMGAGGAMMGAGGAAMGAGGAAMGAGGAAMGAGGAAMGAGGAAMGVGGTPAVSAAIAPFYGMWKGTARNGNINYAVEISVEDRALNQKLGLFHVPAFDCGGVTTLSTLGATLVYKESLDFDPRRTCGPAGTTTLASTGADTLSYSFFDGKKTDKGTLVRVSSAGALLPSSALGLWSGVATNLTPSGTQTVNLALFSAKVGSIAGHVAYPTKNCGGTLTLAAANAGTFTFSEKLSRVVAGCMDGNTITISVVGAQLNFHWAASNGAASGDATLSAL